MSVTCYNPDGSSNCGDPEISDNMREEADRVGGYIVNNETEEVIYDARTGK